MKKLLELRKEKKAKKPDFVRQQGNRIKKLKTTWRQPKGGQSKLRRKFKGHFPHPSMGFSSPKAVRGLHSSGLKPVNVYTVKDLSEIDAKKEGIVIGKIGKKKRVEILKEAGKLKLSVLNIKNPQEYITKVEEEVKSKKKIAEEREEKKKKSKSESLKKAEEKKKEETKEEGKEEKKKKTDMQKIIEKETK